MVGKIYLKFEAYWGLNNVVSDDICTFKEAIWELVKIL